VRPRPGRWDAALKGSIFILFEEFVTGSFGEAVYEEVLDETVLETSEPFVGPGTYPATDLLALVTTACRKLDLPVEDAVRAFGRFCVAHLAGSVPEFVAHFDHPRPFLLTLESVVHTEVRKVDPEARPPEFLIDDLGADGLLLHYRSPLRLFPLVSGLLDGCGDWFGQPFEHECTTVGDEGATFHLRFAPVAPAAAPAAAGTRQA
jgi:hypothetical protein